LQIDLLWLCGTLSEGQRDLVENSHCSGIFHTKPLQAESLWCEETSNMGSSGSSGGRSLKVTLTLTILEDLHMEKTLTVQKKWQDRAQTASNPSGLTYLHFIEKNIAVPHTK
jgi:hypothetical protein